MNNIILTSSFNKVAKELFNKKLIPTKGKVAFIPDASDVYEEKEWMFKDRDILTALGYKVFDVHLKNNTSKKLLEELSDADIIFVAGGNTSYLTYQAHSSGFDLIIKDLLTDGKIYIGSSAGSLLLGPSIEPFAEEDLQESAFEFPIDNLSGLGLVNYILLPHYPEYAKEHDEIAEKYKDNFEFIKLRDDEYQLENYEPTRN